MKTCPTCGTKTDSKFCPECGFDLSSALDEKVCPNCGTVSTSKFCPECGTTLIETEEKPVSTEAEQIKIEPDEKLAEAPVERSILDEKPSEEVSAPEAQVKEPEVKAEQAVSQGKNLLKSKKKLFIIIGAVLLALILIGIFAGGGEETSTTPTTEATYEEETTEATTETATEAFVDEFTKEEDYDSISYDKLARNPDDYENRLVKGSGNVLQVLDGDTEVDLRVGTSSDGYDDVVYLYYDPQIVDSRILEDDQVTYYGRSLGLYTYESTMGSSITIPLIEVHKITRD